MTREEIREGLAARLFGRGSKNFPSLPRWKKLNPDVKEIWLELADTDLEYLHSQGVAIMDNERHPPENPFDKSRGLNRFAHNGFELACLSHKRAGYTTWKPLVEMDRW